MAAVGRQLAVISLYSSCKYHMAKLVVFREAEKAREEIITSIEQYLSHLVEVIRPFDQVFDCSWNERRNKLSVHGERFKADVVLVPKGVVVMTEIPLVWYPFRKMIEDRINMALDMIIDDNGGREG